MIENKRVYPKILIPTLQSSNIGIKLLVIGKLVASGVIQLITKAGIGLTRSVLMSTPLTSHSTSRRSSKLGSAEIGLEHSLSLINSNALRVHAFGKGNYYGAKIFYGQFVKKCQPMETSTLMWNKSPNHLSMLILFIIHLLVVAYAK